MHTSTDKRNANRNEVRTPEAEKISGRNAEFEFVDNRAEPVLVRKLRDTPDEGVAPAARAQAQFGGANQSSYARRVTQVQKMADNHSARQKYPVQRKLKGPDMASLKSLAKSNNFAELSAQETWTILNDWVTTRARAKDPPTIQEAASYLKVTATQPAPKVKKESSDIKEEYNVKTGCALQALIAFNDYDVLGQSSAEALHNHIWTSDSLSAYRNYDVDWEKLYTHVGLTLNEDHKGTKAEDLPVGVYICEVVGHMMVVNSTKKNTFLTQDGGNAIGKLIDVVVKSSKKT